jgi:FAD synthetase
MQILMSKFKKILVGGTFDHLHVGHQFLLHQAKGSCECLIVVVAREATVLRVKGKVPKNSEATRLEKIQSQNLPNTVVRLGREDGNFHRTIEEENPEAIFLGYDQRFNEYEGQKKFPHIQFVRVEPYFPEFFKSSRW